MQIFPNQQQQDFGWDKVSVVGILLWSLSTFLRYFSKIVSEAVAVGKQKCQILTTDTYIHALLFQCCFECCSCTALDRDHIWRRGQHIDHSLHFAFRNASNNRRPASFAFAVEARTCLYSGLEALLVYSRCAAFCSLLPISPSTSVPPDDTQ